MKRSIHAAIVLLTLLFAHPVFAQTKTAFLKYDINGKAYSLTGDELGSYNKIYGDGVDERKHTQNHLYVDLLKDLEYKLEFAINTEARVKPAVGKLPFVEILLPASGYLPSIYIGVQKYVGEDILFYETTLKTPGKFEITKVEGDWIEGTFELVIDNSFVENDRINVTNGSFRFKLEKEMLD